MRWGRKWPGIDPNEQENPASQSMVRRVSHPSDTAAYATGIQMEISSGCINLLTTGTSITQKPLTASTPPCTPYPNTTNIMPTETTPLKPPQPTPAPAEVPPTILASLICFPVFTSSLILYPISFTLWMRATIPPEIPSFVFVFAGISFEYVVARLRSVHRTARDRRREVDGGSGAEVLELGVRGVKD